MNLRAGVSVVCIMRGETSNSLAGATPSQLSAWFAPRPLASSGFSFRDRNYSAQSRCTCGSLYEMSLPEPTEVSTTASKQLCTGSASAPYCQSW